MSELNAEPVTVADGFGNEWDRCDDVRCDLHVVRPGKAQCNGRCIPHDLIEEAIRSVRHDDGLGCAQ